MNVPLIKLPPTTELTLYLIREELKSQKFFNCLQEVGMDDCYYKVQLGRAILTMLEMDDGSDEVFEFYYRLIEKRSRKLKQTGRR